MCNNIIVKIEGATEEQLHKICDYLLASNSNVNPLEGHEYISDFYSIDFTDDWVYYGVDCDNDILFYNDLSSFGHENIELKSLGEVMEIIDGKPFTVGDKVVIAEDSPSFEALSGRVMDVLSVFQDQEGDWVVSARELGNNYVTLLAKSFDKLEEETPVVEEEGMMVSPGNILITFDKISGEHNRFMVVVTGVDDSDIKRKLLVTLVSLENGNRWDNGVLISTEQPVEVSLTEIAPDLREYYTVGALIDNFESYITTR